MKLRGVGGGASCAGGDGVGAVGEKLGGTGRGESFFGGVGVVGAVGVREREGDDGNWW